MARLVPSALPRRLSLLLLTVIGLVTPALSDPPPYGPNDATAYDTGKYGWYPRIRFKTTDLEAPHVLQRHWDSKCDQDDDQYFVFAPYGFEYLDQAPLLLDHEGHMVLSLADNFTKHAYGLTVQKYRGKDYLTIWSGDDKSGHGFGDYYMFDTSYRLYKKFRPVGGDDWFGDLHEFAITKDNHALITRYTRMNTDLTRFNIKDGRIWNSYFQEFDIETREVIFQWNALDHFDYGDCSGYRPKKKGHQNSPWDWFHINSVQKDSKGNYLISSRYCYISYIDGKTGKVIWRFGGKRNDFMDLSNGHATNFTWQHHARWHEDSKTMTIFDNRAHTHFHPGVPSAGLEIALDLDKKTAKLLTSFVNPNGWVGESQGSIQRLPNGQGFVVGFGHGGAVTEFDAQGNVVCDIQYTAMHHDGLHADLTAGQAQSYRAFKQKWVGHPYWNPSVAFENSSMFVSWNGATEVRYWKLQDSSRNDIDHIRKSGFESNFTIPTLQSYLLFALDKYNITIGTWAVDASGVVKTVETSNNISRESSAFISLLVKGVLVTLVAGGAFYLFGGLLCSWYRKSLSNDRVANFQVRLGDYVPQRWHRHEYKASSRGDDIWQGSDDDENQEYSRESKERIERMPLVERDEGK